MFALTKGTVKIGDAIEYAVKTLPGLVIDVTELGCLILTAEFTNEFLPFGEGHWVTKRGYVPERATWENHHTNKIQNAAMYGNSPKIAHRSTNGLRVTVLDVE